MFFQDVRVITGQTYMASCYLAVHRGKVKISIEELAKDGSAYISWIGGTDWVTESQANASNRDFSKYRRVWFKFTAPNTGNIRCYSDEQYLHWSSTVGFCLTPYA